MSSTLLQLVMGICENDQSVYYGSLCPELRLSYCGSLLKLGSSLLHVDLHAFEMREFLTVLLWVFVFAKCSTSSLANLIEYSV